MGKMTLDPNAQAYSDDEVVGKVNAATAKVDADQVEDGTVNKVFTATEDSKLAGIDENAKDDQSGAEIKAAYEGEVNAFTDAKDTKLTGIDPGAEVNPADLAALDPTADTKLDGIDEGAKVDQDGDNIAAAINAGTDPITRESALSQADLKLVKSEPVVGEHVINFVVRKADGKLEADYKDTPES